MGSGQMFDLCQDHHRHVEDLMLHTTLFKTKKIADDYSSCEIFNKICLKPFRVQYNQELINTYDK